LSRDEIENRGERLTKALFERALKFRDEHIVRVESYDELKKVLLEKQGFVVCNFKPSREVEAKIKEETKATVRVILGDASDKRCIVTGENGAKEVVFAIAY
jgi:prolyl-tRNA synthetase